MKKIFFFLSIILLLSILSNQEVCACDCAPLIIENVLNEENTIFSGTVYKVISKKKMIVKVDNNYSINSINKYIIVTTHTTSSPACGVDFGKYDGKRVILFGSLSKDKLSMKVNSCSRKVVNNGYINYYKLDDTIYYEKISLQDLNNTVNLLLENNGFESGDINDNSLSVVYLKAYYPYILFSMVIGVIIIVVIKKYRDNRE